jgi:hypothetical protein
MSYNSPIIPVLTLKGVDAKIQEVQIKLDAGLSWVVKCFGLADRIVETRNDKPYIFPAVFESNVKDPINLMPSDAWNSYCFWIKHPESKIEDVGDSVAKMLIKTYEVSCIFYLDISKIDNVLTYKETKSKFIEDIFNFFDTVHLSSQLVPTKFIEDDITEIFKGFTIDQVDNKWKMYPKWACRIDFDLSFRDGCYSTNTYSHT